MTVAFQDSCHLLHAQRVRTAPRTMLAGVPGLVVAEPPEQELCCGSAGIYNMVQPEAARELIAAGHGRALMQRLRALVGEMKQTEEALMRERFAR